MELLDSVKFVKNGYAKTDLIPELTHFIINSGRITAYNGTFGISCPIALAFDIAPQAGHFYKCIEACEESISLTIEKGKLRVKSKGFKAIVDCIDVAKVPSLIPKGISYPLTVEIIPALKKLLKFPEIDNTKPFANGILFSGGSVSVTNGRVFIEIWTGNNLPLANVPKKCIQELCKIGEEPESILIEEGMIYFLFSGERWIASKLLVDVWPVSTINGILSKPSAPRALPEGFWEALERLNKFADEAGKCYFRGSYISTHFDITTQGASFDCAGLTEDGIYNAKELIRLKDIATAIDFSTYPNPVLFTGPNTRGAFVGYCQ